MTDINIYADQTAIDALTPITGDVVLRSSDEAVLLYNGTAWKEFQPDAGGFIQSIDVYDNETDFISETNKPAYNIVHAKDTDKLYVWDGSAWYIYNHNSMV